MNKVKKDVKKGYEFRRKVAAHLSNESYSIKPVMEFMDFNINASKANSLGRRIRDFKDAKGLGLDYVITNQQNRKEHLLLIRRYTDPTIFIKGADGRALIDFYQQENALILHTNLQITQFSLLSMKRIEQMRWVWRADSKTSGNANRFNLYRTTGATIRPNIDLPKDPIDPNPTSSLLPTKHFYEKIEYLTTE